MEENQRAAWVAWADQFEAACQGAATALDALAPVLAAGIAALQRTLALLQQAYRDVGAPYGDTDAGFTRWLQDLAELATLDRQVQAIAARQQAARAVQAFVQSYKAGLDKP